VPHRHRPGDLAVGPDHQTHELAGLYVADASLFPTASGVNPMLSVMALAHRAAGRRLRRPPGAVGREAAAATPSGPVRRRTRRLGGDEPATAGASATCR
jgi:choline dehydrogenase-like flavoprotein